MSCAHLTLLEVARTLDVLGVVDLRVTRPAGHRSWVVVATTDDGYEAEAHAALLDEAVALATGDVVRRRREQRRPPI